MDRVWRIVATIVAFLGVTPFIRPKTSAGEALIWGPKLLGGALSPIIALAGGLAALRAALRRDWVTAGLGALGAGLAARLIAETPDADRELADVFGEPPPDGRTSRPRGRLVVERDVVFGRSPVTGRLLRADVWLPPSTMRPSGLGLIYAHGSGWRVGDKDLGTRPFFRRLTGRGHVILDIAYTLWPKADLPAMVEEVNQAILWLKENGPAYGVKPDRVVLMGGSAGAHLALMAAYGGHHPAFRAPGVVGDTSVRGVVAFYPPVDLTAMTDEGGLARPARPSLVDRAAEAMMTALFAVESGHEEQEQEQRFENILTEMLGGTLDDVPEMYRLLSPIRYTCAACPPTLLLQGTDDVFGLAPAVRRLYGSLRAAGATAVLIEFPHAEHAFDLVLPRLSPMARAATRGVERFLARLE